MEDIEKKRLDEFKEVFFTLPQPGRYRMVEIRSGGRVEIGRIFNMDDNLQADSMMDFMFPSLDQIAKDNILEYMRQGLYYDLDGMVITGLHPAGTL